MFIHGFLGSSWLFEKQIEDFSDKYHTIAIDHLGHGKSDKPKSEQYDLVDLAHFLEQTLLKIIGKEKIILIGHSMGGMIALTYATDSNLSKRLEGLILMSTSPKLKNPGLEKYIEELRAGTMSIKDRSIIETIFVGLCFQRKARKEMPELVKEFVDLTLQNEEYVGLRTMESIVNNYNVENKLKNIQLPVLILTGDKDTFILPEESKSMHEQIPNSELVVFSPKIGHMIQFEAYEEYKKALKQFIEKI